MKGDNIREALCWKPRRRGPIYCAPACGSSCTHVAYMKAHADANRLRKRLARTTGPGWQVRVTENMGWHWKVVRGTLSLYEYHNHGKRPRYGTLMSDTPGENYGGSNAWHVREYATTPEKAVEAQRRLALVYMKTIGAAFDEAYPAGEVLPRRRLRGCSGVRCAPGRCKR